MVAKLLIYICSVRAGHIKLSDKQKSDRKELKVGVKSRFGCCMVAHGAVTFPLTKMYFSIKKP